MKLRFFRIPLHGGEEEGELNRLLASERVAEFQKHLVTDAGTPCWAIAVTLVSGEGEVRGRVSAKAGVDYKALLPEDEFAVFAKLREARKQLSHAHGVATYTVATNQQLAEMVQGRVTSREAMARIRGVGEARMERYGDSLLAILGEEIPKLGPAADAS